MARPEFTIEYTAERNRVTMLFRVILAIPHLIIENIGSQLAQVLGFFQWFAILFTSKHPRGMFDAVLKVHRYMVQLNSYVLLMTDDYPKYGS